MFKKRKTKYTPAAKIIEPSSGRIVELVLDLTESEKINNIYVEMLEKYLENVENVTNWERVTKNTIRVEFKDTKTADIFRKNWKK